MGPGGPTMWVAGVDHPLLKSGSEREEQIRWQLNNIVELRKGGRWVCRGKRSRK